VSHPIPLHTADRLERTLEALSQRVESSGDEGWVMRILAMLISRCLDHFVEMIEDLLAKIRAGTIVLPDWAYDPPAIPAEGQNNPHGRPSAGIRRRATGADASSSVTAPREPGYQDTPPPPVLVGPAAPHRAEFGVVRLYLPMRCPKHATRGVAGPPPDAPRAPLKNSGPVGTGRAMSNSLRYRNELTGRPCEIGRADGEPA
jgi:hypothetical protein